MVATDIVLIINDGTKSTKIIISEIRCILVIKIIIHYGHIIERSADYHIWLIDITFLEICITQNRSYCLWYSSLLVRFLSQIAIVQGGERFALIHILNLKLGLCLVLIRIHGPKTSISLILLKKACNIRSLKLVYCQHLLHHVVETIVILQFNIV